MIISWPKVSDRYAHSHAMPGVQAEGQTDRLLLSLVLTLEKFVAHLLHAYLDAGKKATDQKLQTTKQAKGLEGRRGEGGCKG